MLLGATASQGGQKARKKIIAKKRIHHPLVRLWRASLEAPAFVKTTARQAENAEERTELDRMNRISRIR